MTGKKREREREEEEKPDKNKEEAELNEKWNELRKRGERDEEN